MINNTLTTKQNPWYTFTKSASKKGVAGFGNPTTLAALSRNTAQFCGFFVRASLFGGLNGGAQARRLMASASVPVFQPCSSRHPHLEMGVTVSQPTHWRPHMAHKTTTPTQGSIESALRAILDEVTPYQRPYSGDSYLPSHLIEAARDALSGIDQAAHQHAHNALSTACWHIARGEAPQALSRLRRAKNHIMASMEAPNGGRA
jgi:hypothetical protein